MKITPPKVRAGSGFTFEDKAGAIFAIQLLAALPPLFPEIGTICRIDFQTQDRITYLDDVLLTLTNKGGIVRCATSIKSNSQFSDESAPHDLVARLWNQFLGGVTDYYNPDIDLLVIVASGISAATKSDLDELLGWSRHQDPATVLSTLYTPGSGNQRKRNLFESFRCPDECSTTEKMTDDDIARMLSHLYVLDFDADAGPSTKINEVIVQCRSLLRNESLAEAESLWVRLIKIVNDQRIHAGYLDLERLVNALRSEFYLKDYPDYRSDWEKLSYWSKASISVVHDKIGTSISLERKAIIRDLDEALTDNTMVTLLGPSGSGKTVAAKIFAVAKSGDTKVLWCNAENLENRDFSTFESSLGLAYHLEDLFTAVPENRCYLVIDRIDRVLGQSGFENISILLRNLKLEDQDSPWRAVFTCRSDEWQRIQNALGSVNFKLAKWQSVQVDEPSIKELKPVVDAYPVLQQLLYRSHLRGLLCKPKVLDLLVTAIESNKLPDTARWVGESDLIKWFIESEILGKPNGAMALRFMATVAEKQADQLRSAIPFDDFAGPELTPLEGLSNQRICTFSEGKVAFTHDVFGDWSRQQLLLQHVEDLEGFLQVRLLSPLWHRATRLLGVHLLEQHESIEEWKRVFGLCSSGENADALLRDLLLEAVIFAANPLPLLELLRPILVENSYNLMQRLLKRFLIVATFPNPMLVAYARSISSDMELYGATHLRIPFWIYWIPILNFLYVHREDLERNCPIVLGEIVDTWLRSTKKGDIFRLEAGEIAVELAEFELGIHLSSVINIDHDGSSRVIFHAALAACAEHHDRMMNLALVASGRREPNGIILEVKKRLDREAEEMREKARKQNPQRRPPLPIPTLGSLFPEGKLLPPWPDGPIHKVDRTFQDCCLDTDAISPLIMSYPKEAVEVLLALLIRPPERRNPRDDYPDFSENLGVNAWHKWSPPFYTRGPFLMFLNSHPQEGLDLILRLTNFAAERWAEYFEEQKKEVHHVEVALPEGQRRWIAGSRIYHWYRDHGPCPLPISCCLMALEKWLYDAIDNGKDIEAYLQTILQQSNSVAFAGLLMAVGCKDPTLFTDTLRPLLAVPEFYYWESVYLLEGDYPLIGWHEKALIKLAQDWHKLPHRRMPLIECVVPLFLNDLGSSLFLESLRTNWQKRLDSLDDGSPFKACIALMIAKLDPSNYETKSSPEVSRVLIFNPPIHLLEKQREEVRESSLGMLLLHLPTKCLQLLEDGHAISDESAEDLWNKLQRLLKSKAKISDPETVNLDDAISGVIAVLFLLNKDWRHRHKKEAEWCKRQVRRISLQNPYRGSLDNYDTMASWQFDRFCAAVVPVLWSEDPGSKQLREIVAVLVFNPHFETLQILFSAAANFRTELGSNFSQMQNLLIDWAQFRHQQIIKTRRTIGDDLRKINEEVQKWIANQIARFIKGGIEDSIQLTEDRFVTNASNEQRIPGQYRGYHYNIDRWLIKAAFSWLPACDMAINNKERREWLRFWRVVADSTIRVINSNRNERGDIEGMPDGWDEWVFNRISVSIVAMKGDEQPELLWQPLLDLGPDAHEWIEDFFQSWFNLAPSDPRNVESFLSQWQSMVQYALGHEKWKPTKGWYSYRLEETWNSLMGIGVGMSWRIDQENRKLISRMKPTYEEWAPGHLSSPGIAINFAKLLQQDAAHDIRLDGLVWLQKAAATSQKQLWSEHNAQEVIVALLNKIWKFHKIDLTQHKESFTAFKHLLKSLADCQNVLALELLSQIGNESLGKL